MYNKKDDYCYRCGGNGNIQDLNEPWWKIWSIMKCPVCKGTGYNKDKMIQCDNQYCINNIGGRFCDIKPSLSLKGFESTHNETIGGKKPHNYVECLSFKEKNYE